VELNGPESPAPVFTTNVFSVPLGIQPGFYTVNVIAVKDGIPHSGSFSMTVE
jgi:hypothetical protein